MLQLTYNRLIGFTGYRSPLRPVPDEVLPEIDFLCSVPGESGNINPVDEERLIDSCGKQEWWHEAIKVAEEVEQIQKALDLTLMVSSSLLTFQSCQFFAC